jgi:glutamine synthetase
LKEGFTVDGSSIKGMSTVEKSDLKVVPEVDSYLKIQIGDFIHHRYLAHFADEFGKPHMRDPRNIFQRIIDKSVKMGYVPSMFSEIEFYIVDKKTGEPVDQASYCSMPPHDVSYDFRHELGKVCEATKMVTKRIHHECGPG